MGGNPIECLAYRRTGFIRVVQEVESVATVGYIDDLQVRAAARGRADELLNGRGEVRPFQANPG
jgi:hypothetical protein